ncbi:hypothetical protein SERLA73DRAFT_28662, partial [Serpula lacrymans var. lacrymans S7.3]
ASTNHLFTSEPFLLLITAHGPAMAYLNRLVSHNGKYNCRFYYEVKRRLKENGKHYCPALLKPSGNYNITGLTHQDLD